MRLGRVVRADKPRLVLLARRLCLAEGKAARPPQALYGADFLDRFLEPVASHQYHTHARRANYALLLTRPVVENIVLLEFLRDVVRSRQVRAAITIQQSEPRSREVAGDLLFPYEVPTETYGWQEQKREVKHPVAP